jgi:hypothetical protein
VKLHSRGLCPSLTVASTAIVSGPNTPCLPAHHRPFGCEAVIPQSVEPPLVTSGTDDHVVPLKVTQEVFDKYQHGSSDTALHVFEGKGHSLTIDGGWKDVADVVLDWLTKKGL